MSLHQALEVINKVDSEELFNALILQVEKDFNRAQIPLVIDADITPNKLVTEIFNKINNLISKTPSQLNQLLYLIDLDEKSLSNVSFNRLNLATEQITYLILKREWQKVYLRSIHSAN